ncbi:unnamed protein product, partial [Oikopleura dioica]
TIHHGLDGSG